MIIKIFGKRELSINEDSLERYFKEVSIIGDKELKEAVS